MIRDLSETLSALLAPALPSAEISFERPTDAFQPAQTTVNLFLYDVRENLELRNNEPVVRRVGTVAIKEPPPVRLDCAYIVTAWPVGGTDLPLQEHRLLSESLRRLLRFPTIPPEFLRGSLIGQQPPLPTVTARPDGLANPAEFWTALGSRLRAALTLKATIGVTAFDAVSDHLVLMKQIGYGATLDAIDETFIQIGGRVVAPALAVRAQANLASAANSTATLAAIADSALFRPGDIVLLTDAGNAAHTERVVILDVNGTTIRLARSLPPPAFPAGSTMRIADLAPRQDYLRLDRVIALEPGSEISLTQNGTTDSAIVRAVDHGRRGVSLQQGLAHAFAMGPGDPPVTIQYGVAGATVEALNAGLRTTSRESGRYAFGTIPTGVETIRVTAAGFQPATVAGIQIPQAGNQNYDVVLTPL
jgi:hypothetical protein